MNVYMVNSSYEGCCYVRVLLPAFHNGFKSNKASINDIIDTPEEMQKNLAMADVVVFHRPENNEYYNLAKILKENGKKIIVDNDDTFKIDDHYPLAGFTPDAVEVTLQRRDRAMDKFLKIADLVTTSTEFLAEEYRKLSDNVIVLPNCVDPLDWEEPKRTNDEKVRIGMVGSVAFEYDYLHLKDILRHLGERDDVELVLFGLGNKQHRIDNPNVTKAFKDEYAFWDSVKIEQVPWCPIAAYPNTLNNAKLDIMLIPRKDNYFNRCKSNIKFLEAAMCEIPVIAQSFEDGPYEELTHKLNGLLIDDNNSWMDNINYLIDHKDIRRRIGKNAKEYVLNNYNIEDYADEWYNSYKKVYEKRN